MFSMTRAWKTQTCCNNACWLFQQGWEGNCHVWHSLPQITTANGNKVFLFISVPLCAFYSNREQHCSSQMHLQWLTFDSPYWQRGPWNPAGHWHTWGPSLEHFPPLKQVSAAHSTRTNRTKQSGFCLFCAKDSPELPPLFIAYYNRTSK